VVRQPTNESLQVTSLFPISLLAQSPQHFPSTHSVFVSIGKPYQGTRDDSWRAWKALIRLERAKGSPRRYKLILGGTFDKLYRLRPRPLTEGSFQDALRAFFQPIKTDDPHLDFYTMYKREATEYDADYVKKYDEDLNTTLIFVRCSSPVIRSCQSSYFFL